MRDPNASWWLKIRRAQERIRELEILMIPFDRTRDYRIAHRIEPHSGKHTYTVDEDPPDPLIAVVVGDFLYDIRSALDHIAGALVPRKFRYKVEFPIFPFDPAQPPTDGLDTERYERAKRVWSIFTEHAQPAAFARLRALQPFDQPDLIESHTLVLANGLYNADKHRELVTVVSKLRPMSPITVIAATEPIYRQFPLPGGFLTQSDAPLWSGDVAAVEVKLAGTLVIGVRARSESIYEVPRAFARILAFVRDEVLEPLDQHTT